MSACRKSLDSASANLELFMFFLSKLWEIQLFFMVLACYQIQHCISKCASFQLFSFIWTSKYDQEDKVLSHIIEYKSRVITLILLGLFQCYTILNENFHVHFKAERKKKKKNPHTKPPPPNSFHESLQTAELNILLIIVHKTALHFGVQMPTRGLGGAAWCKVMVFHVISS